jgi:Carboxypeptidase regulatory-like domain
MTSLGKILLRKVYFALFVVLLMSEILRAQTATGGIRGLVTDPSGGTLVGATVLLTTPSGGSMDTTTGKDGYYEFKNLAPGTYEVKVVAKGFSLFTKSDVSVTSGKITPVNISMVLEVQQEKVVVQESTAQLDVNPSNNANTIVLQGKDLDALSDDPDELQSELEALAGPSAGPNGGQIYIDGFTAGQLPPKASIREIRINQNPFSAEYDKLGYGRIEVFTKPGTDKIHGQFSILGNSSAFNSRNPFEIPENGSTTPSYHSEQYSGNIGGPLSKKASFFFNVERRNIQTLSVVSATILDPDFNIVPFSSAVPSPQTRTNISGRIDYQLTPNNTLTARYQYFRDNELNNGVGQFDLAEMGTNELSTENTFQLTDTQIIGAHVINELRFQYLHENSTTTPLNSNPTVSVGAAFTGNGSGGGSLLDTANHYELQNTTYLNYGKHAWKVGGRLRATQDDNTSTGNYNGQFTFNSISDYQTTLQQLANGLSIAQIRAAFGVGPAFFTETAGKASASVTYVDVGLFLQDDWKVRQNVTISYGLRFETQNNFSSKANLAPRLGFAWGIGGNAKNPPKTILRGGFGIFYDRFTSALFLQQERQSSLDLVDSQVRFQVTNPDFYLTDIPPVNQLPASGTAPNLYLANNNLHAPYTMQTGLTLERQLTKTANVAVTYLNSRGVHQFYTNNLNPFDPATGERPNGVDENILQYQSEGTFKQNQLIVNGSVRAGTKITLFGYYTLNYANSDVSTPTNFPSNPFDLQEDYGRASFDVRHRLFFGGSIPLPKAFRISPFLIASSGAPFNITTGTDPYLDSVYNVRPSFGTCPPGIGTKYGCFDVTNPTANTPIPINLGEAPGRFTMNLRVSKTFGFGPVLESAAGAGGGGGPMGGGTFGRGPGGGGRGGPGGGRNPDAGATNRRYSLTLAVVGRNIFNNVNVTPPIGNLSAPPGIFGVSNALAGRPFSDPTSNRRFDLQLTFSF